jgi:hypothetical protein
MQRNIDIAFSEDQPLQQPNQQKGNQRQKKTNNQQHDSFSRQKGASTIKSHRQLAPRPQSPNYMRGRASWWSEGIEPSEIAS